MRRFARPDGALLHNAQGMPTNAVYIFVTMLRKLLGRPQAGVHRRVVRPARTNVSRRLVDRLQSQPRADARRARRPDSDGARGVRSPRRADSDLRALRSRRCDRDAGRAGGVQGVRRGDRHDGQGLLSARARRRSRLQSARRRHVVRLGWREGEVRRAAGPGRGRDGADGRHHRQHQRRAGYRREGREGADRQVRNARQPDRARLGADAETARDAARQRGGGASEPRAGAHSRQRAGRVRLPRPSATAAARASAAFRSSTSWASARSSANSRRRPPPSPGSTASSTPPTACGRWPRG